MRTAIPLLVTAAASAACSSSNAPAKPSALASIKIVGGASQTAPASTILPESIVVVATDSNGHPGVHLGVAYGPSGQGTTGSLSVFTDNAGRAATTWKLDTTVGQQSLLVTVEDAVHTNNLLTDTVYATATGP